MRHTTAATVTAAVLLALTGCSTEADNPTPASSTPTTSAAGTEQPPADDGTAALEQAVRAYSAAYFATDAAKAHGMMSARCQAKIPADMYGPVIKATVKQYGVHDIKTLTVDQMSGDLARVTYTYPVPALDQTQQPWAREGGAWRYDAC